MAFEIGTANDVADFITKFETFLTSHADLVSAGHQWTIEWSAAGDQEGERLYRAPGLGADGIFVAVRYRDEGDGDRGMYIRGATGANPLAEYYQQHVNISPPVGMAMDGNPFGYWFVANDRRFMVVLKISTVYEACYGGLYLPYAPPTTYGYPMFIGGSVSSNDPLDWRMTGRTHHNYPFSEYYDSTTDDEPQAYTLTPIGDWLATTGNYVTSSGRTEAQIAPHAFPGDMTDDGFAVHETQNFDARIGHRDCRESMMQTYGGDYALTPLTIMQRLQDKQTYGVLDGAFAVPGTNNYVENLVAEGGVDHLVVQDAYRTGFNNYWAMALE